MITFHPFHLEVSLPVAKALLAFASKDATRQHICGVAIEDGKVCATDGHTAVMFDGAIVVAGGERAAADVNSRVWARSLVETAVKVARAEKRDTILLQYGLMLPVDVRFPPLARVMPDDGIEGNDCPIGFNPSYTANLAAVAKACGHDGVMLTSLRGALDPIGFRATGTEGISARAAIMPMRI
jgi:hypothetical protein